MPKFIHWVPTKSEYIDTFFELCPVSSSDIVYDLGSGDGRLLFAALEKGAGRCVGIEIDHECVKVARKAAENRGIDDKVKFIEADVTEVDLSEASVIFSYLFPTASAVLRSKFEQELKPGSRVVMEAFWVPGWQPAKERVTDGRSFYYYTIPPEKTKDYDTAINDWNFGYNFYDYYLI